MSASGSGSGDSPESGDVGEAVAGQETKVRGAGGAGPSSAQASASAVGGGSGGRRGGGERRMVPKERPRSYHGQPVVKEPAWTKEIPWYFAIGGMAGASATLGLVSEATGNRTLARRAYLVSLAGVGASPVLLISDLGRPERFLYMLRMFKPTSPMSVGSWILSATGATVAPAALAAFRSEPGWTLRLCQLAAAVFGPALATYTSVLVTNTAIPAWSEARKEMAWVFAASSAASAGAAAAAIAPADCAAPARRLAVGGALAEVAASTLMEHRLGRVGEPYSEGRAGKFGRAAKALGLAGAGLIAKRGRSRPEMLAGAGMVLAGTVCVRWSVFEAGFQSARDPSYTVELQRSGP